MTYLKASEHQPNCDGRFLCVVRVTQPCGTVWWIEQIIERVNAQWVLGEGAEVTKWTTLPYGGWPKYSDAEE